MLCCMCCSVAVLHCCKFACVGMLQCCVACVVVLQCCVACVALLGKENLQHVHEETPFIVGYIYQALVTVYAELYMAPGTHLSAWCVAMRTVQSTIAVLVFCVCSYKCLKMLGRRWFCMLLVLYHFYLHFVLYVLISALL